LSKTPKPARQPLQPLEVCNRANQRLHIGSDWTSEYHKQWDKYVMVMTDGFTKFCEVAAIPHKSATVVARTLFERWIVRSDVHRVHRVRPGQGVLQQGHVRHVQLVEDQEEEDVTLSSTSKHRSGKFQRLVQKVLHDNVREHENIRMGGTIAVLNAHV
jgi:hypothetical protein